MRFVTAASGTCLTRTQIFKSMPPWGWYEMGPASSREAGRLLGSGGDITDLDWLTDQSIGCPGDREMAGGHWARPPLRCLWCRPRYEVQITYALTSRLLPPGSVLLIQTRQPFGVWPSPVAGAVLGLGSG
jgi:hypothetical protein